MNDKNNEAVIPPHNAMPLATETTMADRGLTQPQLVDSMLCPLCSRSNNCAVEDGQEQCWCMEQSKPLTQAALDMIPTQLKNKSCICKICWHSF